MNVHRWMMIVSIILAAAGSAQHGCGEDESADLDRCRLLHNNPDLTVDLGVGLWAIPFPVDWDGDGDSDLLVSTADVPYKGLYYFENAGTGIFKPGKRIGPGKRNVMPSYTGGGMLVFEPGKVYKDFKNSLFEHPLPIPFKQDFYAGRTNQWRCADFDGDGVDDLIFGASDWREYGWDNAYDSSGRWTNGPIRGFVYWAKNTGSGESPQYCPSRQIMAGGKPLELFGCPSPNLVDWDGDGDLDLICGEFLDRITLFENIGGRTQPEYAPGRFLEIGGKTLHMELQMLQVVVFDWDQDHDPDIIVGQEDGRVAWIENAGMDENGEPVLKSPVFFQQYAHSVKCGALATPYSFDWDGDGDEDLICGNTAGFVEWIENLGGGADPQWAAPVRLKADGRAIRIMAGENLSIQGPAEAKWGYTVPFVADWDMDGLPDIVINTIVGEIVWYKNIGARTAPQLAKAQPIEVMWPDAPPKPAWNWWDPKPGRLVVQWRTRPIIQDIDQDGLNDLVLIDHEGFLSFFKRGKITYFKDGSATEERLVLHAGQRIFLTGDGNPLQLNDGIAGKSGRRKIDLVDWDADGDLDLLINSPGSSPAESRNIAYYENIGKSGEFVFRYKGDITGVRLEGHTTSPTTVDWDADGVRDLLVGGEDGFFYYFKRTSSQELLGR